MKVVMVDDSQADRRLCQLLLSETMGPDLEFWGESSGASGLGRCRAELPDCVLLDYKLPDMTGVDFLTQLQASPAESPDYAVVMLTGLADERVAVDAMKAGAQDYLVKDRITAEGLFSAVGNAVEKVTLLRRLQAKRDRLAESLAEKEVLLKEVHHRVKNNLQVIASLLRLQANALGEGPMVEALRESQNRVESMALVHEQLYETEDLREVDLTKHSSQLLLNLFTSYGVEPGRIAGHIRMPPCPLGVDRAIPAGLILNELISNALKHAFPDGRPGALWIEGGQSDGQIRIAVRDNGAGISSDFELRRSKSLGLEIVQILTRQLKGKFEIDRPGEPETGAIFRLTFPIA